MARWQDFVAAEPEFAHLVQRLLSSQKHMTLATPRRDGSPKISGTEAKIVGGDLVLGMMGGSLKVLDLLRDPRLALHSPTFDPLEDDHGGWLGDAKVATAGQSIPAVAPAMDLTASGWKSPKLS